MNTAGHEGVADDAGLPLLRDAFGKDKRSLRAMYLGNWITDVSQAVDPVAYWMASTKISRVAKAAVDAFKKALEALVDELIAGILTFDPSANDKLKALKPDLEPVAKAAVGELQKLLDALLGTADVDRSGAIARLFRDAFLLKGYFKFVHRDAWDQTPRMDFECFMRVFGRASDTRGATGANPADDRPGAYTQYYPHEHMDRPELLSNPPRDPAVFEPGPQSLATPARLSAGKQSGLRAQSSTRQPLDPDLYSYIRDQVEMTAGLLAEVDEDFERACRRGVSDNDPQWHLTLAKLGHALHQVEDFFAHSNWIEHAYVRLGKEYLDRALPPQTRIEIIDRAYTTFHKRLRRHLTNPLPKWRDHPDELWVVTGYFDFQDTLISLSHVAEEIWGGDVPDPYAQGYEILQCTIDTVGNPRATWFEVQQTLRHALDFLTDPKRALDDDQNAVAKSLKSRFGEDVRRLTRPEVTREVAELLLRETPALQGIPPEIYRAFLNVIVIAGSRIYTAARYGYTIYDAIHQITIFLRSPVTWLELKTRETLKDKLIDALKFYGRERFYDAIGMGRIGCHSLMAKDHGSEPLYDQQRACATAVHWYIVSTLLRWRVATPEPQPIDWLELLEYFARHPMPPAGQQYVTHHIPVTLEHVVTPGQTLRGDPRFSLEARYKPSALDPASFTWRTIADANFATKELKDPRAAEQVLARVLEDPAVGVPGGNGSFALKAGLRLVIPHQRADVSVCEPIQDEMPWFRSVIDKGWEVFRGIDNPDTEMSEGPLSHHQLVPISRDKMTAIAARGRTLRREARQKYRPAQ